MDFHHSEKHPQREYPAMASFTVRSVVETDEEFEDFLHSVRVAMERQQRWSVGQGEIEPEESDIKLEWGLVRLDKWRRQQANNNLRFFEEKIEEEGQTDVR